MMDAIGQLVYALDYDQAARQPTSGLGCSIKDFCSHYSNSFDGIGHYISAENWLNDMEELLKVIGCIEEQKVMFTAQKLLRDAKRWWQVERKLLVMELGDESAITWTQFKEEFNNQYFPWIV